MSQTPSLSDVAGNTGSGVGVEESKGPEPLAYKALGDNDYFRNRPFPETLQKVQEDWKLICETASARESFVDKCSIRISDTSPDYVKLQEFKEKMTQLAKESHTRMQRELVRLITFSQSSDQAHEAVLHIIQNGQTAPLIAYQFFSKINEKNKENIERIQQTIAKEIESLTRDSSAKESAELQEPHKLAQQELVRLVEFARSSKQPYEAVVKIIQDHEQSASLIAYELYSKINEQEKDRIQTIQNRLDDKIKFLTPASPTELQGSDELGQRMAGYRGRHPHQESIKRMVKEQKGQEERLLIEAQAKAEKIGSRLKELEAVPDNERSETERQKIAFLQLAQRFYTNCVYRPSQVPEILRDEAAFQKIQEGNRIKNFLVAVFSCLSFGLINKKSGTEQIFDDIQSLKEKMPRRNAVAFQPNPKAKAKPHSTLPKAEREQHRPL